MFLTVQIRCVDTKENVVTDCGRSSWENFTKIPNELFKSPGQLVFDEFNGFVELYIGQSEITSETSYVEVVVFTSGEGTQELVHL
jgi:hypothetical protein